MHQALSVQYCVIMRQRIVYHQVHDVVFLSLYLIKKSLAFHLLRNIIRMFLQQHAVVRSCKSKEKREHWLDHADDKYDADMIEDIKSLLRVLVLFIPLPVFWALFDQQACFKLIPRPRNIFYTIGYCCNITFTPPVRLPACKSRPPFLN